VIAVNVGGKCAECTHDFGDAVSGLWLLFRWLWSLLGLSVHRRSSVTYAGVPSAAQVDTPPAIDGLFFSSVRHW